MEKDGPIIYVADDSGDNLFARAVSKENNIIATPAFISRIDKAFQPEEPKPFIITAPTNFEEPIIYDDKKGGKHRPQMKSPKKHKRKKARNGRNKNL